MISIGIIDQDKQYLSKSFNYLSRFNNMKLEFCYGNINTYNDNANADKKPDILLLENQTVKLEGIRYFKEAYPQSKIIIVANELDQTEIIAAIKLGISAYLVKTGDIHDLYLAITTVYTGGGLLGPHVAKIVMDSIRKEDGHSEWSILTKRERDFAEAILKGLSYKEIADKLYVSTSTVNFHLQNIYSKLDVRSRAEFVSKYYHKRN